MVTKTVHLGTNRGKVDSRGIAVLANEVCDMAAQGYVFKHVLVRPDSDSGLIVAIVSFERSGNE